MAGDKSLSKLALLKAQSSKPQGLSASLGEKKKAHLVKRALDTLFWCF